MFCEEFFAVLCAPKAHVSLLVFNDAANLFAIGRLAIHHSFANDAAFVVVSGFFVLLSFDHFGEIHFALHCICCAHTAIDSILIRWIVCRVVAIALCPSAAWIFHASRRRETLICATHTHRVGEIRIRRVGRDAA